MHFRDVRRVQRAGSFSLPMNAASAFPLFTAEGERHWVPGWSPEMLGDAQEPGMVFLTGTDDERTIWTVLESDQAALRHRYSRVTPGSRAGIVEVKLTEDGPNCRVHVRYDLTALPGAPESALDGYSQDSFDAMMVAWRSMIEQQLPAQ